MKKTKRTFMGLGIVPLLFLGFNSAAKTDVPGALEQIKVNEHNAKSNKKQYEENSDIAAKNIVEVSAAIKQLREQKVQLVSNAQNLEKNRAVLDKMREKLQLHGKEEAVQIAKETAQIAVLKATLDRLEGNIKQRQYGRLSAKDSGRRQREGRLGVAKTSLRANPKGAGQQGSQGNRRAGQMGGKTQGLS